MSLGRLGLAVALAALLAGVTLARADQISDLNNQLELLAKRIELANKQKELATVQGQVAATQKQIALDLAAAAASDLARATAARTAPPIRMSSGVLSVIADSKRHCDGLPFLRWQCNGQAKCDFTVDANICGLPGLATEPMELALSYDCGGRKVSDVFPFGRPAKLTCN